MDHNHEWVGDEHNHFACACGVIGHAVKMPKSKYEQPKIIRANKCFFCKSEAKHVIGTTHKQMRCDEHKDSADPRGQKELEPDKILTHDQLMIDAIRNIMGMKNLYGSNCKYAQSIWLPLFMTDGNRMIRRKELSDNISGR